LRNFRVLIDTNVLVDGQLRDLFLTMAHRELYEYWWSDQILAELQWAMVNRLGRTDVKARGLCETIKQAFPQGDASIDETTIRRFVTPDPGDAHVLAAAVTAEADMLITDDRAGFPDDAAVPHHHAVRRVVRHQPRGARRPLRRCDGHRDAHRRAPRHRREGRDPVHGRSGQGLPVHDEREHQDR
jgi:predicted nucleic acid-binding protein